MKIVIDARELRTSTGRYIERLLNYLQKIDDKNDYVVLLKPDDFDGWMPLSSRFTKQVCPYREFSLGEQVGFLRQINKLSADLVHFGMVQQPAFYRGDVVTTMHDLTTARFNNPNKNRLIFKLKQLVYIWLNKRVARRSRSIIVPSQFVRDDIISFAGVRPEKFTVTYEAADSILEPAKEIEQLKNKPFVFYVGRAHPHKNLGALVNAFQKLIDSDSELLLVFVGKRRGNYETLERMVQDLGLQDKVMFTDFVSEGELKWLYQNARAYVFPSLSEGFGLPGLEAMVHGCPVVSSYATCLPEVYGDAALYFDPNNPNDMAAKIQMMLEDDGLRAAYIKKGQAQASTYSWERTAEQTLDVYNHMLGSTSQ